MPVGPINMQDLMIHVLFIAFTTLAKLLHILIVSYAEVFKHHMLFVIWLGKEKLVALNVVLNHEHQLIIVWKLLQNFLRLKQYSLGIKN
jgi:hypothetical protein